MHATEISCPVVDAITQYWHPNLIRPLNLLNFTTLKPPIETHQFTCPATLMPSQLRSLSALKLGCTLCPVGLVHDVADTGVGDNLGCREYISYCGCCWYIWVC